MDYRVEELASRAGLGVDTIRYYQSRGLLPPPRRQGRIALYDDGHLERLREIRRLADQGLTLSLIRKVLAGGARNGDGELIEALVQSQASARTYTRAELADAAGLPEALLQAAQSAGLLRPVVRDGQERFGDPDRDMARAGIEILQAGLPLPELLSLALEHARGIQSVTDRAIDLFDDHVRKRAADDPEHARRVTEAFRTLLPHVTRLVALHFQRTLVTRALERLSEGGEDDDLRAALAATEDRSLEVSVGWR